MAQTSHPSAVLTSTPTDDPPPHRIWVGGPVPPGADAWTLGSLIIVRRGHEDSVHLLHHELEHVRQYRDLGFVRFLACYLADYLRLRGHGFGHDAAYRRIPSEVQAEWRTRRRLGVGVVEPRTRTAVRNDIESVDDPGRSPDDSIA